MSTKLPGAALAPSAPALRIARHRPEPRPRGSRRWWFANRDPSLDDRLLRDIGLTRADVAAFLL